MEEKVLWIAVIILLVFAGFSFYSQQKYVSGDDADLSGTDLTGYPVAGGKGSKVTNCVVRYDPKTGRPELFCPGGFKCSSSSPNIFSLASTLMCEKCGDSSCKSAGFNAGVENFGTANNLCKKNCKNECYTNEYFMFEMSESRTCTDIPQDDAYVTMAQIFKCGCMPQSNKIEE